MDNNAYLAALHRERRGVLLHRRGQRGPDRLRELVRFEGPPVVGRSSPRNLHPAHVAGPPTRRPPTPAHAGLRRRPGRRATYRSPFDERLNHGDTNRRRRADPGDHRPAPVTRPGSVAVLYRDPDGVPHLFTGDSLFRRRRRARPGRRTTSRRSSTTSRRASSACCPTTRGSYPGHGNDSTLERRAPAPARMAQPAAG